MRIIITAGGTTELIDPVRKITNSATGRLGSLIAEQFAELGGDAVETIHYVCERESVVPELPCLDLVRVRGVAQTASALRELLGAGPVDAVVHSMAVSDYTVGGVATGHDLVDALAALARRWAVQGVPGGESALADVHTALTGSSRPPSGENKLPSGLADLVLLMEQTPKVIHMVKTLQPRTVLVGFKLLNAVGERELLAAARRVRDDNDCDFVLANDQTTITATEHRAMLLARDDSITRYTTKAQIAEGIARSVFERIGRDGQR